MTKAYAYLSAEQLGADYSMVCYSGYGIITGYTENDQKLTTHLLPDYYERVGKSEGGSAAACCLRRHLGISADSRRS